MPYTLNPKSHYIFCFIFTIIWLLPCITNATEQSNTDRTTPPDTSTRTWHPYPRSIQLRSGSIIGTNNDAKNIVVIPTTVDVDILYAHPFFARHLESFPRIGLSFLMPYTLQQAQKLNFPKTWGILAYIELYQSHPALSTWGNRVSIGAMKGGILIPIDGLPNYSFLGIEEITYHYLCKPSLQLNFSMGLLLYWWTKTIQNRPSGNTVASAEHHNVHTLNSISKDIRRLKLAPLATIGIRYIAHTKPFLGSGYYPIQYKQRKSSRIDCSIAGSSKRLASTQTYYWIFRGAALLSLPINAHNGLLCSMELGYNQHKKALLANTLPSGGLEMTTLLGYEIRYGRYVLQLQLGYEITDGQKVIIQQSNEHSLSSMWHKKGRIAANLHYMLTERFFVGVSARFEEMPALRLGVAW